MYKYKGKLNHNFKLSQKLSKIVQGYQKISNSKKLSIKYTKYARNMENMQRKGTNASNVQIHHLPRPITFSEKTKLSNKNAFFNLEREGEKKRAYSTTG